MTTTADPFSFEAPRGESSDPTPRLALSISWSRAQPERVGEVAVIDDGEHLLGRGEPQHDDPWPRLEFRRARPGVTGDTKWLDGPGLSRRQLKLHARGAQLTVERIGRGALLHDGVAKDRSEVRPGDRLIIGTELVVFVTRRPPALPALVHYDVARAPVFGAADLDGIVGESPVAWALRERLAFLARSSAHVLVSGPSGSGKELAVRALHAMSSRSRRPLVARNAATFPESLLDAEVFGCARDYPNAGMPERQGLVGDADGSTLFLDEIAELPLTLQAHLLRVLDADGEYHRLGEARTRRADLRVVAATNRPLDDLRSDFAARFTLRCEVPPLGQRAEDLPLLARDLVLRSARSPTDVASRFVERGASGDDARFEPGFIDAILARAPDLDMRSLEALLWRAMEQSRGPYIEPPRAGAAPAPAAEWTPRREPEAEEIRAALERVGGSQARAWRLLGLSSRHALHRLMKRHGIAVAARTPRGGA